MGDDDLLEQLKEQTQRNAEALTGDTAEAAPSTEVPTSAAAPGEALVEEVVIEEEVAAASKPAPKPARPKVEASRPQPKKARTYTVKSGDTLSAIGERFGVSWQKIAQVNHIKNPDLIFPGQEFVIPD